MVFEATRNQEVSSLTATSSAQELTINTQYRKTIITVLSAGTTGVAIRVQINGNPDSFDADTGILVTDFAPLVIDNHFVESLKYIRESGQSADVKISVLGMWH